MSDVIKGLRASSDPLENDLARVYDHWQEVRRTQGKRAGLGYEPRDINASGAVSVISSRVLNASAGFEEIDPDQSYEALVLNHPDRFPATVIAAAQKRIDLGAIRLQKFLRQDIQFFIKSSSLELFRESGILSSRESWVGREVHLPELHKDNRYAHEVLATGFRSLVWLHETEKHGERGQGLTAVVDVASLQPGRRARILDAMFFARPVGKELLEAHKDDGSFISKVKASRHDRIWPVSDSEVASFLFAVREKAHKVSEYEDLNPDPRNPLNLERIEDATVLRQAVLRRYQAAFRRALLNRRPNCCALTGTSELSVLEAAHIIPYAERFADRDKLENGLLLRSDIHKLFDAHLISISPANRRIEVSGCIKSREYLDLRGKIVSDELSSKSLDFHFENFKKRRD